MSDGVKTYMIVFVCASLNFIVYVLTSMEKFVCENEETYSISGNFSSHISPCLIKILNYPITDGCAVILFHFMFVFTIM